MKKHIWTICFSLALTVFTVYISLDTFVIGREYNTNAVEINTSMFEDLNETQESEKPADSEEKPSASEKPSVSEKPDEQGNRSKAPEKPAGTKKPGSSTETEEPKENSATEKPTAAAETEEPDQASLQEEDQKADENEEGGRNIRRPTSNNRSSRNNWSNRNNGWQSGGNTWGNYGRNYSGNAETSGIDAAAEYTGDTTYQDENVTITLKEYTANNTAIYVADVIVTSARYLKTAFANNTYGKNVTAPTSTIAQANDAILAINGDYYGAQEKGYVIRNGVVYRDRAKGTDVLCIYADGTMEILYDRDYTAEELVEKGVWQAFSFGPALVENGSITVDENESVGREMASNPRTAIGVIDANHFVFVVSDGRTDASEGLSLYQLAEFMRELGVQTAYNLDGGGSSTMYFNGQVVNNPTSTGRIQERSVSDIVYIGKNS